MSQQDIRLSDRFDLEKSPVLLNGTQALVRLMLIQRARDAAAGLDTAGYVTGYRGSPLGAVDMQMARAHRELAAAGIVFQPGLNEDLAATALWGTQQAGLRGEGRHQGVFGLWYGKGPGVDRSGDVMRHANMAGTAPLGGVIMAMGDDHTGESSTTLHQSDWAMVDAYMPVLSPAGVQEILDYGVFGFALSRFAGVWAGLKLMKDTVEATAVVDGRPDRMAFVTPDFTMPEGGLNIRLQDTPVAQEARLIDYKRFAAEAFGHANRIDRPVWGDAGARIGFVAAGKNWLDLIHALDLLGIGEAEAQRLGLATYKVGQTWPLDMAGFNAWAEDLDLIVVVEEKRKLIEVQIKEAIFDDRRGRRVFGWRNDGRRGAVPTRYALDPVMIAESSAISWSRKAAAPKRSVPRGPVWPKHASADNAQDLARAALFLLRLPAQHLDQGARGAVAAPGIGCHFMAQWMDRSTEATPIWAARARTGSARRRFPPASTCSRTSAREPTTIPASRRSAPRSPPGEHHLQDPLQRRRRHDRRAEERGRSRPRAHRRRGQGHGRQNIAAGLRPEGRDRLVGLPQGPRTHERDALPRCRRPSRSSRGVSAIIYVQTCAAEKRRRRKRGTFPDIDKRVFINTDVCEGCGDCGVQSNCVSIVPVETELGRKRAIDQSTCNKDFSCLKGFCPSFVTVEGGTPKKGGDGGGRPVRSAGAAICPPSTAPTTSSSPASAAPAS
jgi:indolepyruvate ferredoxin oxidoreductase